MCTLKYMVIRSSAFCDALGPFFYALPYTFENTREQWQHLAAFATTLKSGWGTEHRERHIARANSILKKEARSEVEGTTYLYSAWGGVEDFILAGGLKECFDNRNVI